MSEELKPGGLLQMATTIVAAHVSKSSMPAAEIPRLLSDVYQALSSLAEYQILSGNVSAGERSFYRAKGTLQLVPKENKPSATGMVYRDVSEAFWTAGDHARAVAVFKEGLAAGGDQYLYMSSAARAAEQQPKAPASVLD